MSTIVHPFPFEHPADSSQPNLGGVQYRFTFTNGYGASVIRFPGSYGSRADLWELAVTSHDGGLIYDTPITDDVLGYLTEQDVATNLDAICRLPERAR